MIKYPPEKYKTFNGKRYQFEGIFYYKKDVESDKRRLQRQKIKYRFVPITFNNRKAYARYINWEY